MSNNTNNGTTPPHQTEDYVNELYTVYASNRKRGANNQPEPKPDISSTSAAPESTDDGSADNLYRIYQSTREPDFSRSINQVMNQARGTVADPVNHEVSVKNIMSYARANREPEKETNVSKACKWLTSVLTAPTKAANKLIESFTRLSRASTIGIGAVTAGIVAVLLIPLLMTGPAINPLQPNDSLRASATSIAQYIESPTDITLGFSNSQTPTVQAFHLGVSAMDLALANVAGDVPRIRQSSQVIYHYSENNDTLIATADSLHKATTQTEYSSNLNASVQQMLQALSDNAGEDQWFILGYRLEAIYLTAELAIQTDQKGPLTAALSELKANVLSPPFPLQKPADSLLEKLLSLDISADLPLSEIRDIRDSASDIKALVY